MSEEFEYQLKEEDTSIAVVLFKRLKNALGAKLIEILSNNKEGQLGADKFGEELAGTALDVFATLEDDLKKIHGNAE